MSVVIAELSEAKRRLLEKMLQGEAVRQSMASPLPPRDPGVPTPLAPSQQPIWLHAQMAGDARIYNEMVVLSYLGPLNAVALERSLNEIVRRHGALRTVFAQGESQVVQAVRDDVALSLPVVDLTAHPEREAEFQVLARIEADRPFDLAAGPLMRAKLFRMAADEQRLLLVIHHIVLDGVSLVSVLLPELTAIYDAFSAGLASPLPEPAYQYADFALWQERFLESDSASAQIAYWGQRLAGQIPTLQLPIDRPRNSNPSYRGEMVSFAFPPGLVGEIERACKMEGVTRYTLLLAAFKALLYRYSGQDDILLGSTVDIRSRLEFQDLIGFFVNTVVLRTHPAGEMLFREFLRDVEETVHGAISNRDVPLDRLLRELHPHRDVASRPLFQVMFSFPPRAREADPRWRMTHLHTGATKFDLLLDVEDTAEGLTGNLTYDSALFDAPTIRGMIDHYLALLAGALKNPEARLADLPILSDQEWRQLNTEWNGSIRKVPEASVATLIRRRAEERPESIAVECRGERMTYDELNRRSDMYAWRLHKAGVGVESLVGIRMNRSCEMVAALVGILKTGGAYLPVDPSLPVQRQRFLLEDGLAAVLLTERSLSADGALPSIGVVYSDEASDGAWPYPEVQVGPDDLAYVIYTSGSTGQPKGAEITQRAFLNLTLSVAREPGFTAQDTMLAFATLSFDAAVSEIFVPLIAGGRVVLATEEEQLDPVRLIERMSACGCTMMQATPATWRALVESGWAGDPGLKVLSAGETLPRDLAGQLISRSAQLWNMYGPTETTVYAVIHRVTEWDRPIPIGHPVDNARVWVLDRDRNPAPTGVTGEVYIGGWGLARGYRGRPHLTNERFQSVPALGSGRLYRTGDLARWLPDGILEYLGRVDNQVKIRGFRVEVEEVEAALNRHPAVKDSAVKAWPDSSGNMALAAYVVAAGKPDLRASLRAQLPHYMVPSQVVFLDALPLNQNGKVDRKALARPRRDHDVAPGLAQETERRLAAIWESILERQPVGRDENFFDLGGHSLLVTRLIRAIESAFGRRVSMASIFEAPTVAELAALLDSSAPREEPPHIVNFQPAGSLPPLFWTDAGPKFRDLSSRLNKNRPFIGLSLTAEEQAEFASPHPQWMESAAARLVRAVRARQPHGPYYLGGWCAAGTLAYEMAVQLKSAGEEVALLVLLDSANYEHFRSIDPLRITRDRIVWHVRRLFQRRGRAFLDYALNHLGNFFSDPARATRPPKLEQEYQPFVQAAYSYKLKPFDGSILAISPQDRPAFADLNQSWRDAPVTSLRVVDVPGDHNSCMHEPYISGLAECINGALDEAGKTPAVAHAVNQ